MKTRRARLSPSDCGLPARTGHGIPGLRREEVAALAGVGLTWYTWLEQGRDIQVSTTLLEQVTRALKLSEAERAHLFALAHQRAPPLSLRAATPEDAARIQPLLDAIRHPAYARNGCFDVLAWNEANTRMFGDFAAIPTEHRNVIRLMFTRPGYRQTIKNWEADACGLLGTFRRNLAQAVDAEPFHALVGEMGAISADFSRLWASHEVSDFAEGVTALSSRRHGEVVFHHATLIPEALPHLRLVVYTPG